MFACDMIQKMIPLPCFIKIGNYVLTEFSVVL